jgi:multicomponent Na+:H+ antiporter subunit F
MTLSAVATVVLPIIALTLLATFWRLVKGPDLPDRVVAMDLITALGTGFLLVYALFSANSFFLDVAIILALISFLGTVAFAFFIKNRHRKK